MHFMALLIPLLATVTYAQMRRQLNYCAGNKATVGYCETLTYIDRTSSITNPPATSECQDACRGLFGDAGDWGVSFIGSCNILI